MDNTFDFKSFDLFKVHIPISYENNYLYKTSVGAVLTIISFLIITIYTIYQISTLLDRSNYTIITSETQDLTGEIDLSYTPIMFQLVDLLWNPVEYDPKLFTFTASNIEASFQNIGGETKRVTNIRNLEIERCDKLKKEFIELDEFFEYDLTKYMCIKPNQNLILYGSATDTHSNLKNLEIKLSKCNDQLNNCYDLDTFNKIIKNRIFAFTYLGYTTNFTNIDRDKNVEYKIYTNYIKISKNLGKTYVKKFYRCKLNLFDNFFVTHKTVVNYFFNKYTFQDYTFIEDSSNSYDELIYFNVMYSGDLIEYTKDIKGIGPTFSYIMAAFNTVIIICRIINDYYGHKILISDLFQFLKNKNINFRQLSKHKGSKEIDFSKNDLISKTPINDYVIDAKGNFVFNVNKSSKVNFGSSSPSKFKDKTKITLTKYSKKDYWKFCIYPYYLINKNQQLSTIKGEICSIFSLENILENIRSLRSLQLLRAEFYEQVMENKVIIDSCKKVREFNDHETKSKLKIGRFSETLYDK